MSEDLSKLPLAQIKEHCQQERNQYRQDGTLLSPACVELFRRAFMIFETPDTQKLAAEERARLEREKQWAAADIVEIFDKLTQSWMYRLKDAKYVKLAHYFTAEAPDLVRNKTFEYFFRNAPRHQDLIDTVQLGRLMAYLEKCTESATKETLLSLRREKQKVQYTFRLDQFQEEDQAESQAIERVMDKAAARQLGVEQLLEREEKRRAIDTCLEAALQDERERRAFFLRYECGEPPRAIFAKYQAEFPTYKEVENTLRRITRHLEASECWQKLTQELTTSLRPTRRKAQDDALLKIELDHHPNETKKDINVDTPCPYSEEMLLDYLCGLVSTEIAVAIEASPCCQQAAQQLAQTHGPWLKATYRLHCLDVATLLAYIQRELPATERLVCYRHLAHCTCCQEELAMIATPEPAESFSIVTGLRRVLEAVFQSPLAMQFQGEWLQYSTPQVTINIDERKSPGKSRMWTVRAQVRDQEGQQLTSQVELATLEALTPTIGPNLTLNGTISATSISFRDLPAGDYSLQIVLPEEEIIIRKVTVGFTS